jgi:MFS family permease
MSKDLGLEPQFLAHLTSAIQLGFISGTLVFAIFTISDRFSPSRVFFMSSIIAGIFNLGLIINHVGVGEILVFRFLTGFFLAGIYPVGMKIASDYYQSGLGKSLGFLVGALVLGTAFPHLLKNFAMGLPWKYVIYSTTALSVLGGLSVLLWVPDGPYYQKGKKLKITAFLKGFKKREFRVSAFGYFGHMWELYAFWTFVPVMLTAYASHYPNAKLNVPLFSFMIIALGGISCVAGGFISQRYGAKRIATISLPFLLLSNSVYLFLAFLFIWGIVVIADSPLFSTLVAQNAPEESRGTSLTIVNCIGFSITIVSIQTISFISNRVNAQYVYMLLAIGPILGLLALLNKKATDSHLEERAI